MPARISNIVLKSGAMLTPSDNITLIVGPNNVGKSVVLQGVWSELSSEPHSPTPVHPVQLLNASIPSDFLAEREGSYRVQDPGSFQHGMFHEATYIFNDGPSLPVSMLPSAISRTTRFGALANSFATLIGPEGRGSILNSTNLPDLAQPGSGRSPVQKLWADESLEAKLDGYMWRAFNEHLLVNRSAGINVHLHVGETDIPVPRPGEISPYLDEVLKLPMLAEQGHGVQAFMGTLLSLAASRYDIVLLDEPETFLHPPQARLLGEVVAELSRNGGPQVLIATHSDDFVQGVLTGSKNDSDVVIARITRPSRFENRVAQIEPEAIKKLYGDPLLRFSQIMDGIFYKGVVLCEAESDCTYYSATLASVEEQDGLSSSDLLFAQCGGKDRFAKAHGALAAAGVPTAIIADVDILSDRAKFKGLFESLGGQFAVIESAYNVLEASVKDLKVEPRRSDVKQQVEELLASSSEDKLTRSESDRLREIARVESGWKQVKRKGEGAIDKGGPQVAFKTILEASRSVGLFILPVGELERFHKDVAGNKQEWLRQVLEGELFKDAPEAKLLILDVLAYIGNHQ